MMLLESIQKEMEGLKEKHAHVLQQIQQGQRELQRLQDTNLVISGALQALTHILEQNQKAQVKRNDPLPTITEEPSSALHQETDNEDVDDLNRFLNGQGHNEFEV